MRLIELLTQQDEETISRLVEEHLQPGEAETRRDACINLEAVIRSPRHIRSTLYNRRPPCFWIIHAALECGLRVPLAGLRQKAAEETQRLAEAVTSGTLVGNMQAADLYRRVLLEAWGSDFELEPSEIALLSVLRRELGLRNVDHFLIEHHAGMRHLWDTDHAFLDVLTGLRSGGLAHVVEGCLVIPIDVVPVLRQVLGIEAGAAPMRRLYEQLSSAVLRTALEVHGLRSSGSKPERVSRLIEAFVQPSTVLDGMSLVDLKQLCGKYALRTSGSKDSLVDRLVSLFASGADLSPAVEEEVLPEPEDRALASEVFVELLSMLRGQDLSDILTSIGSSRVTGAKEHLVNLIVGSPYSEDSLLRKLELKQLEPVLKRLGIRAYGTKSERVDRLVEYYSAQGGALNARGSSGEGGMT